MFSVRLKAKSRSADGSVRIERVLARDNRLPVKGRCGQAYNVAYAPLADASVRAPADVNF